MRRFGSNFRHHEDQIFRTKSLARVVQRAQGNNEIAEPVGFKQTDGVTP